MNIKEENSLATEAHAQIDICCQTLCEKEKVKEYILYLENEIARLEKLLLRDEYNEYE